MNLDERVELGDIVKDTITGFEGVAVGITRWLHGCRRITVQPEAIKDGKPLDTQVFDEPQVEVVTPKRHMSTSRSGGPGPVSMKRPDVSR